MCRGGDREIDGEGSVRQNENLLEVHWVSGYGAGGAVAQSICSAGGAEVCV